MKRLRKIPAAAVILAGGRSRRMGRDKAGLRLGGERLVDRLARLLRPLFSEILVSTGSRRLRLPRGTKEVRDRFRGVGPTGAGPMGAGPTGAGPLAGIHAAMRATRKPLVFAVACDMPLVSADLVRLLWSRRGRAGAVPEGPSGLEPLCAFYSRALLEKIERRMRSGDAPVRVLARLRGVRRVPWRELKRRGIPRQAFAAMNRPSDLERVRTGLSKGNPRLQ